VEEVEVQDMRGECALCEKVAELQLSHIVPKFVFTWLKQSGGGIRANRVPNRRIQDGQKEYLLCLNCEQLFSGWERIFCEQLFVPLHCSTPVIAPIIYGPWALRFAVSISWRVLQYYEKLGLSHYSAEQKTAAIKALETWRKFLLGQTQHPGRFEQHFLPVDVIESHTARNVSPFLNRYMLRNVHMDVICSKSSAIVYTKLCRLILFGFIQEENRRYWKGTKLHVKTGVIKPREYSLPGSIVEYMNDKANQSAKVLASLSPKQKGNIRKIFREQADEIASSEVFRAMRYDVVQSGKAAFKITDSRDDDEPKRV
jgi:hypothetical protein